MKIWIDADACPKTIKEVVWKCSARTKVPVVLVANSGMTFPHTPLISLIVVDKGLDVADHYIIEHVEKNDLVITADIPLADSVVKKQIVAINPRGEIYSEHNIGDALASRNLMTELRGAGHLGGGPPPIGPKDKAKFANSLDREVTRLLKK